MPEDETSAILTPINRDKHEIGENRLKQNVQRIESSKVEDDSIVKAKTVIQSIATKRPSIHEQPDILNWKIVAFGKRNTNKSAIINGILGQQLISYPATDYFDQEINGVKVGVWDIDTDSISIEHYETVCTADTKICFFSMATTMEDHTQTIKTLSRQFGQSFWEKCVIVLYDSYELQEQKFTNSEAFEKEMTKYSLCIRKALLSFNIPMEVMERIQIVPSGKAGSPHLLRLRYWFSNICWQVLRVSSESSQKHIAEIFEPRIKIKTLEKPDECGELYSQSIDISIIAKRKTKKQVLRKHSGNFSAYIKVITVVAFFCVQLAAVATTGFVLEPAHGFVLLALATAFGVIANTLWILIIMYKHTLETLELRLKEKPDDFSVTKQALSIMVILVVAFNGIVAAGFDTITRLALTLSLTMLAHNVGVSIWELIRGVFYTSPQQTEIVELRLKTLEKSGDCGELYGLYIAKRVPIKNFRAKVLFMMVITLLVPIGVFRLPALVLVVLIVALVSAVAVFVFAVAIIAWSYRSFRESTIFMMMSTNYHVLELVIRMVVHKSDIVNVSLVSPAFAVVFVGSFCVLLFYSERIIVLVTVETVYVVFLVSGVFQLGATGSVAAIVFSVIVFAVVFIKLVVRYVIYTHMHILTYM